MTELVNKRLNDLSSKYRRKIDLKHITIVHIHDMASKTKVMFK